jgi:hypothetical protein
MITELCEVKYICITVCDAIILQKFIDVSEEHVTSIFRMEESYNLN